MLHAAALSLCGFLGGRGVCLFIFLLFLMPELAAESSHVFKTRNCIVNSYFKRKTKTQEQFLCLC